MFLSSKFTFIMKTKVQIAFLITTRSSMVLKSHKTSGRKELLLISILDFQLRTSKLLPVHGWRVGMVVRCIPKWHRNACNAMCFKLVAQNIAVHCKNIQYSAECNAMYIDKSLLQNGRPLAAVRTNIYNARRLCRNKYPPDKILTKTNTISSIEHRA